MAVPSLQHSTRCAFHIVIRQKMSPNRNGAERPLGVAQIANLLFRRLPTCGAPIVNTHQESRCSRGAELETTHFLYTYIIPSFSMVKVLPSMAPTVFPAPFHSMLNFEPSLV